MIRVGQSFILLMAVVLVSATLSWGQGVDAREQDAVQKLLAFRNQLQLIDERFRDHINVPLSPFMTPARHQLDRELLWYIVHQAAPDLTALPADWQRALQLGQEAEQALRSAMGAPGRPADRREPGARR